VTIRGLAPTIRLMLSDCTAWRRGTGSPDPRFAACSIGSKGGRPRSLSRFTRMAHRLSRSQCRRRGETDHRWDQNSSPGCHIVRSRRASEATSEGPTVCARPGEGWSKRRRTARRSSAAHALGRMIKSGNDVEVFACGATLPSARASTRRTIGAVTPARLARPARRIPFGGRRRQLHTTASQVPEDRTCSACVPESTATEYPPKSAASRRTRSRTCGSWSATIIRQWFMAFAWLRSVWQPTMISPQQVAGAGRGSAVVSLLRRRLVGRLYEAPCRPVRRAYRSVAIAVTLVSSSGRRFRGPRVPDSPVRISARARLRCWVGTPIPSSRPSSLRTCGRCRWTR
jgi:hypothetical protein